MLPTSGKIEEENTVSLVTWNKKENALIEKHLKRAESLLSKEEPVYVFWYEVTGFGGLSFV